MVHDYLNIVLYVDTIVLTILKTIDITMFGDLLR